MTERQILRYLPTGSLCFTLLKSITFRVQQVAPHPSFILLGILPSFSHTMKILFCPPSDNHNNQATQQKGQKERKKEGKRDSSTSGRHSRGKNVVKSTLQFISKKHCNKGGARKKKINNECNDALKESFILPSVFLWFPSLFTYVFYYFYFLILLNKTTGNINKNNHNIQNSINFAD